MFVIGIDRADGQNGALVSYAIDLAAGNLTEVDRAKGLTRLKMLSVVPRADGAASRNWIVCVTEGPPDVGYRIYGLTLRSNGTFGSVTPTAYNADSGLDVRFVAPIGPLDRFGRCLIFEGARAVAASITPRAVPLRMSSRDIKRESRGPAIDLGSLGSAAAATTADDGGSSQMAVE